MHHHAPNPAAQPHLSPNALSAPSRSGEERSSGGHSTSVQGTLTSGNELRFAQTSAAETREGDFDTEGFIRLVSRPPLGVTLRGYPAPCGSALFCFGYAALRVTVSSFAGPSANAELGTWEPGPLARLRQV